jgi:hypothetical protein
MQSSPPVRAHLGPASPNASDYTLDLGALDSASDTETSIPKPRVERIFSEDIDGPSDFTQNMEMWMRGGSLMKRTMKDAAVGEDRKITATSGTDGIEELQSGKTLHVPNEGAEDNEEEHTGSHHTPNHSPPKVSVMEDDIDDSIEQDDRNEPFSSEWQTYGHTSTPVPPVHKQFRQPMVEDYHSELSPARQTSQSLRGRQPRSSIQSRRGSAAVQERSTPGRADSPTLSPARSPRVQRRVSEHNLHDDGEERVLADQLREEAQADHEADLESQLRELKLKCEQLGHLNSALSQAVEEERRLRKQDKVSYEERMAEAKRRERDVAEMKEAAHRRNEDFRREFGDLKEKLQGQQQNAGAHSAGEADGQDSLAGDIKQQTAEHARAIRALEQDLEAVRRSRDDAEETARLYQRDLDDQREDHDVEIKRLQMELQNAREDEAAVTALERRLEVADAEVRRLSDKSVEMKDELKALRSQLVESNKMHNEEASHASVDRSRAVELAAGLQRQVQDLRLQLKEDKAAHDAEVKRLKVAHGKGSETSVQELDVVRAELDAKQAELNEAILERDEAQDTLETKQAGNQPAPDDESRFETIQSELRIFQSENAALKSQLADQEALNIQLDSKIAEAVRNREQYWKQRLEKADEERKLMAKALLHQWGREEVGIESPQRFAYKYTTSPSKSNKR